MPSGTVNYGLVKAADLENYDVSVVNANLDSIDALIKAANDARLALETALDGRLDAVEGKLPPGVTPSAKVVTTAVQSIANNTNENVDLAGGTGTETVTGMLGIANDRLTIKVAGYYIISLRTVWPANSTGFRYSAISKGNPGPALLNEAHLQATGNTMTTLLHTPPTKFDVDDWVFGIVNQNSGGALNLQIGSFIQATLVAGP